MNCRGHLLEYIRKPLQNALKEARRNNKPKEDQKRLAEECTTQTQIRLDFGLTLEAAKM